MGTEEETGNALGANADPANQQTQSTEGNSEQPVKKEGESGTPEATPEKTEDKGAEPTGAEKRIRQLVAERHARDREIERLKGELESKGTAPEKKPVVDAAGLPAKPQAKDYEDYDDYLTDLAVWKGEVKKIQNEQASIQKKNYENLQAIERGFQERIEEDSVKNPDITAIRDRVGTKISPAVGFTVKQSEIAADLIRYLDANPTEIERLSRLDLVAAAKEIGKIEVKLTTKGETKKKTDAPAPIKPAGGGEGSVTSEKSEDEKPIGDYMRDFRARGRKK